jgi:DNA-directed RNA polymerase specialized sigma subunit
MTRNKEKHLETMREYRRKQRAKVSKKGTRRRIQLRAMIEVKPDCLIGLDDISQTIIPLYLEGRKLQDIADQVGVNVATVSRRIGKLRKQLQKKD